MEDRDLAIGDMVIVKMSYGKSINYYYGLICEFNPGNFISEYIIHWINSNFFDTAWTASEIYNYNSKNEYSYYSLKVYYKT